MGRADKVARVGQECVVKAADKVAKADLECRAAGLVLVDKAAPAAKSGRNVPNWKSSSWA